MNIRNEKETAKLLNDMLCFFENVDTELKEIDENIAKKELERDDLLHEIELGNLNAAELMKTAVRLRATLIERRNLKDGKEYVSTLRSMTSKYITKGIVAEIKTLQTNINNLNMSRDERKYTPRILKDLKVGKWITNKFERKDEK